LVKTFAVQLASKLAKRYPPALDREAGRRPSVNRLTRIVEETCEQAVAFKVEHNLRWLGKARLGNEFRWALAELGYSKEFTEFATEAVIVHLSRSA
jgi:hypothetical protein